MKKTYRVYNGYLWSWESEGEYIRMRRLLEVYGTPDQFAEALVKQIVKQSKKIVYNYSK